MANWYSYNGVGDPTATTSYRLMSVKPTCVTGSVRVCAIYLDDTTAVPSDIETTVLAYIANAQGTQTSQPGGGAKRFVYVKGS